MALMDNPDIEIEGLMEHIQGPDFPTAGIINGKAGILQAYRTGRGRIYMRAKADVIEMRKKYKTGNYTYADLGKEYGIGNSTAGEVVRGITWSHIPKMKARSHE